MNKAKISVIIPMYNVEEFLNECLDSVVNQDYGLENMEVILIDDGSTDQTMSIAKAYAKKYGFILLQNAENSGQAISRNRGIKKATGLYTVFLDSDDMLYSNALSHLYQEAMKTEAELVMARLNSFDSKGKYGYYSDKYINEHKVTNIFESHNLMNCISICSKIYKTESIKNVTFLPNTFHEDNSFTLLVLFKSPKIAILPEYLYYRRLREGENKSTMQKLDYKTFEDLILNYKEVLKNIKVQENISFLYKHIVKKLNNYLLTKVKKEYYKKGKQEIKALIDDFKINKKAKLSLKFYNCVYYIGGQIFIKLKR